MKLGIMQPYFLPYIGYFQLINAVDKFVVYDNIQYTKKGWINRNRILQSGKVSYITLPLEKDSDYLSIGERNLSISFDKTKLLNQVRGTYSKAPYFADAIKLFEDILFYKEQNLFLYILNSIKSISNYLEISTEYIISSELEIDHNLKGKNKVLAICNQLAASNYINAIGGIDLYDKQEFRLNNIELRFIETRFTEYRQLNNYFIEGLSILDLLMFNSKEDIILMLENYVLI